MNDEITVWRHGARRLSEDALDKMLAECTNYDLVEASGPVTLIAYPGIISGASRLVNWDEAIGSAVLFPCAHPIQMKASNADAINRVIGNALPIRCGHCMRETAGG